CSSDLTVSGQIDRFGNFLDGSGRYLIHPYIRYRTQNELYAVHVCASRSKRAANYYQCLASNDDGRGGLVGRPVQQKRGYRLRREIREIQSYQHRRHTRQRRPL
ncbi:MAG: hypothetical protein AB7U61_16530, partial [Methylocystis sp.]